MKSIVRIGATEMNISFHDYGWSIPYYGIWLEGSIDLEEYLFDGKMIVLGNIYEHPELMKAADFCRKDQVKYT